MQQYTDKHRCTQICTGIKIYTGTHGPTQATLTKPRTSKKQTKQP